MSNHMKQKYKQIYNAQMNFFQDFQLNFVFSENISTTQPTIDVNLVEDNENHHQHEVGSKWSPLFEGGPGPVNVTARIGSTVQLDCKIQLLHDKTVRKPIIISISN